MSGPVSDIYTDSHCHDQRTIMILILINISSPSKNPMLPKKLDDRLLVQNRFKDRLKHIDRVCAEENWKNNFDLRSHISQ